MDSFLGLFNPNGSDSDDDIYMSSNSLPPEPQVGNIEYKLKIVNPSEQRFEHLVTQLKWRLREGQGEALYEIGVEDNGMLTGLSDDEMTGSLNTLSRMCDVLGARIAVLRERTLDNGNIVAEILVRKVPDDQTSIDVRVAVLGSADAGKSTLLGVLTQGNYDNGRGSARLNMFRHLHEVQSGRTSSISHEILGFDDSGRVINYSSHELMTSEEICRHSCKIITFIDLAGHKKYQRTTIQGMSGYFPHYAMVLGVYILESESSGVIFEDRKYVHCETNVGRINKTHRAVNNTMIFYTDVPGDAFSEVQLSVLLSNRFVPTALRFRRPVCDMQRKEMQYVLFDGMGNVSDICPIPKGTYYMYNFIPRIENFPLEIQTDRFRTGKLSTILYFGDKRVLETFWILSMKRIG